MGPNPAAEFESLRGCLGPTTARAPLPPLGAWPHLLDQAERHRVIGYVAWRMLDNHRDALPPSVAVDLDHRLRRATVRNLHHLNQLSDCLQTLSRAGIAALPYKGAVLNVVAYPQLGARQAVDLDLLIRPPDVPAALRVLLANGYQPYEPHALARLAGFLRYEIELELRHPGRGIVIDLHWRVAPRWFTVPLDLEPLWGRQQPIIYEDRSFPSLARRDHAWLVILHATRHRWRDAVWTLDLAMLLRHATEDDWAHLLAQATSLHVERLLRIGLRLTTELGWTLPPPAAAFAAAADPAADALVAGILHSWTLAETAEVFSWETLRWHWRTRERRRDRWALSWRLLFRLTPRDWNLVRLPRRLAWLYVPLRGLRLAVAYVPRLWRHRKNA